MKTREEVFQEVALPIFREWFPTVPESQLPIKVKQYMTLTGENHEIYLTAMQAYAKQALEELGKRERNLRGKRERVDPNIVTEVEGLAIDLIQELK